MFPPENPTPTFPYRILDHVGTGAMGIVYRATEEALDRVVAIKTLRPTVLEEEPPDVREEMRQRFLQEARAAARLSHPGVTIVHRVGEEEGVPFLVMEWLDGQTLDHLMADRGKLELPEATRLIIAVLEILDAAHQGGVVHRDIKPGNLVLLKDGRLKITDFGIAQIQEGELVKTRAGIILATPQYASPEQLRGSKIDGRSDLFAAGVLFFHLLTGEYPFPGKSFMQLASNVLNSEPRALRDLVPEIPGTIESIIRKALEKNRDNRYANCIEMAAALRTFLGEDLSSSDVRIHLETVRTVDEAVLSGDVVTDLPSDPALALIEVASSWPAQTLETQSTEKLLERLLDKPLHAPAFAGAAVIDGVCLFFEGGRLLGAVDVASGASGDAVAEDLPAKATPRLHPVPSDTQACRINLLTTILRPARRRQENLDSSFINLPALVGKFREEKFDGLLVLERGEAWGRIFFQEGKAVLNLYSRGWDEVPVEESWSSWIDRFQVTAHVEERTDEPLAQWYRHALPNFEVGIAIGESNSDEVADTTGSRLRQLFKSTGTGGLPTRRLMPVSEPSNVMYDHAPAFRLLHWMLEGMVVYLAEREKLDGWKYLASWVALVKEARLYHQLERPGSRESDLFDLVTTDGEGKVLHLGQRIGHCTPERFHEFVDRVKEAKGARQKTGDVGGALLVAPSFDDAVLSAYGNAITAGASGTFLLKESFTGYEGFVRMGPRRGFHLLLVEETADGFTPLIPS